LASLKEGYSEEYKCTCLGLSLAIMLFSPNLVECVGSCLPQSDATVSIVACYAAFLALAYVAGITIDGIVPYSAKDWLLYPTFRGRGLQRPGCSIFKKIGSGKAKDFRFVSDSARKKYSDQIAIASEKDATESALFQNAEWYKLYRKHSTTPSVQSNNLGHLYSRDVFMLSFVLLLLGILCDAACALMGAPLLIGAGSMVCLLAVAVASWVSARWKAKRLVLTVVACDVAADEEGEER